MKSSLMDVVVCQQPGLLVAERRQIPDAAEGEILVRVKRVGICGTDMHIFRGTQPYLSYPRIMGHEIAGVVAEAPTGSALGAGSQVFVVPYFSCESCAACLNGKPNCCHRLEVLGVHRDGALANYVSVPARFVHSAEGVTLDQAAMIEFLAIGAHAVARGTVNKGQRVLVSGAGPIGIACALFAKLRSAQVTVIDPRLDRLLFCRDNLNVDFAFPVDQNLDGELKRTTRNEMFDVVFDATGNSEAMMKGFEYIGHGGSYVLVSVVNSPITFSDPEFHKREATLLGSRNATSADFHFVLSCMREKLIPTSALQSHTALLTELPLVLPSWIKPEAGVIKAVVRC